MCGGMRFCMAGLLGLGVAGATPALGVITAGPNARNESEPTGALAGSGWQYQGEWGAFLGTAIAPNFFITAEHVGGSVGDKFLYNGGSYTTTEMHDSEDSDLRIWKVAGDDGRDLGSYSPLYASGSAAGLPMVVFGKGTDRGAEIVRDGQLAGWEWGTGGGSKSWGANVATGTVESGEEGLGLMVTATFDGSGGDDEGTVSGGDSGGGAFVNDDGVWKLAGINYGVDAAYRRDDGGVGFGALFGQSMYASSIAANADWISQVIDMPLDGGGAGASGIVPEPATAGLLAVGGVALLARRGRRRR